MEGHIASNAYDAVAMERERVRGRARAGARGRTQAGVRARVRTCAGVRARARVRGRVCGRSRGRARTVGAAKWFACASGRRVGAARRRLRQHIRSRVEPHVDGSLGALAGAMGIIEAVAAQLDDYKGFGDYSAEMRGISKACGLNLGDVVAENLV